jgi:hypothetical protein
MNPSQNQSAQTTTETPQYGAPSTSMALFVLFDAAADHLTHDQLDYLADMGDHAAIHAKSLSVHLMEQGCFYANAENLSAPGTSQTAETMWMLSHQLDHISGLIELAHNAAHRLKNPRTEANRQKPQA